MWQYELHPPYLINVAILPCESRNRKNVILQCDITKENCIKHIVYASQNGPVDYKIWGVAQQCNERRLDISDLQKMLDANLGWLWTERHRGCNWPVVQQSEIMYACWWWTLWTHPAKLLFISIMWFIRAFYETVNVIWCIWRQFCT